MAYSGSTLISASVISASERGMSRSESSAPQPSRNAAPTIARPESSDTVAGLRESALPVSSRKSHGKGTTTERIRGRYFFIRIFDGKSSGLSADYLNDHALAPLPVEFGVIDLLPGSQVKPSVGDRQQHLMMHQQVF